MIAPPSASAVSTQPLKIALIAGEHSGDALGAKLMVALRRALQDRVTFSGVGGAEMSHEGLVSLFPMEDVAVMGPLAILPALPRIVRRVYQTVDAVLAEKPDAVVIIDSPEFTHPIAKRIRKRAPHIPIINYVSPSVWAWRSGRAKTMRGHIDEVLALLPFEPAEYVRLEGPHCTYVGHPLIERLDEIASADSVALSQRLGLRSDQPVLLVLPGSRRSEVERLIGVFGETAGLLSDRHKDLAVLIPTVPHLRDLVRVRTENWHIKPILIENSADKFAAMRLARAALAASGTVTLELALAATPMVISYRVDRVMLMLRSMLKTPTIVLANLVLGERAFPELLQEAGTADALAAALDPLIAGGAERDRQLAALAKIPDRMRLPEGTPSEAAAQAILSVLSPARLHR